MRNPGRWFVAVALSCALTLGPAACGDDDRSTDTTETTSGTTVTTKGSTPTSDATTTSDGSGTEFVVDIEIANGAVVGGAERHPVPRGGEARLRVTSDVADEVHVHGYDLKVDVAAGRTAELEFTADIPGVFEIELEQRGLAIGELEVK